MRPLISRALQLASRKVYYYTAKPETTFTGSYTVKSDSTATFTIQSSAGFTLQDYVGAISKKKFRSVEPNPFTVITRAEEKLED